MFPTLLVGGALFTASSRTIIKALISIEVWRNVSRQSTVGSPASYCPTFGFESVNTPHIDDELAYEDGEKHTFV